MFLSSLICRSVQNPAHFASIQQLDTSVLIHPRAVRYWPIFLQHFHLTGEKIQKFFVIWIHISRAFKVNYTKCGILSEVDGCGNNWRDQSELVQRSSLPWWIDSIHFSIFFPFFKMGLRSQWVVAKLVLIPLFTLCQSNSFYFTAAKTVNATKFAFM